MDRPVVEAVAQAPITVRLDQWAHERWPTYLPSRNRAKKAAKAGDLRIDGEPAEPSRFLKPGQTVGLFKGSIVTPRDLPLELQVVYEEDGFAVVFKPAGLLTNGNRFATLERALASNLTPSLAVDALPWPRPVHRLDRATSGLVVCAKAHTEQVWLGRAFEERRAKKRYRALVNGRFEGSVEVTTDIDGRPAHSTITAIEHVPSLHTEWFTVIDLQPHTGRTHQLRRHCTELGHSILGDRIYPGEWPLLERRGLFLCAVGLRLPRPNGEWIECAARPPGKFEIHCARELRRWQAWQDRGAPQTP
ncbi:MAG: pseudouridine synthase [Myxococcota bacterium]